MSPPLGLGDYPQPLLWIDPTQPELGTFLVSDWRKLDPCGRAAWAKRLATGYALEG